METQSEDRELQLSLYFKVPWYVNPETQRTCLAAGGRSESWILGRAPAGTSGVSARFMHVHASTKDLTAFQCCMAQPEATPADFPLVPLGLGSERAGLRLSSKFSQEIEVSGISEETKSRHSSSDILGSFQAPSPKCPKLCLGCKKVGHVGGRQDRTSGRRERTGTLCSPCSSLGLGARRG